MQIFVILSLGLTIRGDGDRSEFHWLGTRPSIEDPWCDSYSKIQKRSTAVGHSWKDPVSSTFSNTVEEFSRLVFQNAVKIANCWQKNEDGIDTKPSQDDRPILRFLSKYPNYGSRRQSVKTGPVLDGTDADCSEHESSS
ncbi:hypothetical protein FQN51_003007 [Onygenales sp. PD_10]|nr:hypothetical protein FQN51_003007 [Onygenales sp. PD_10]